LPSIADQHVVVLGGTSGFGFAIAEAALVEGARVTIDSRSEEKLRGALARLGDRASGECVDVTDKPALERFFAGLGPFDHLSVTVGDPLLSKQIMELTEEEARSAFEVRFWGQFNTVRAAYPHSLASRARSPWSPALPDSARRRDGVSMPACWVGSRAW
jgi:NAD(P)-dependent dehydrogenase (short-subunit alcohol dehydrogenase family)